MCLPVPLRTKMEAKCIAKAKANADARCARALVHSSTVTLSTPRFGTEVTAV